MNKPFVLSRRLEEILKAIHFYRYMSALDVTVLFYSVSSLTHVRESLASLTRAQYLYSFQMPHVGSGNTEKVYTLGSRGRDFLVREVGEPVDWYFRPYKQRHLSASQVQHNLALTRFCIAADRWAAKQPDFMLIQTRICYELAKTAGTKVVPDAWFLFEKLKDGAHEHYYPVLFELDRGMENKDKFKQHLRARIEYVKKGGEYSKVFGQEAVIIAYATTSESERYRETRLRSLCTWTNEELADLGKTKWAAIFRFHSLELSRIYQSDIFEAPVWYRPDSALPLKLFAA